MATRLLVFLDEEIEESKLVPNDIILVDSINQFKKYKDSYIVEFIDSSLLDEDENFVDEINIFFKQLPKEFIALRNESFARFFKPVFSVLKKVKNILNTYEVSEIILKGGNDFQFITFHGGEGESQKYSYKSSWLINGFLHQYFNDTVLVKWEKTNLYLSLLHRLREQPRFLKLVFKSIILNFKNKNNHLKTAISKIRNSDIVFIASLIEFKQISQLLYRSERKVIYLNSNSSLNFNDNNIYKYATITIRTLLKSIRINRELSGDVKSKYLRFFFEGKEMLVNRKTFLYATRTNFIRNTAHFYELHEVLCELKKKENLKFITGRTFGDDIILVNNISKLFEVKHYNFQIVTMAKVLLPQMDLADFFYLYSKKTYNFYKNYSNNYHCYLPLIDFKEEGRKKKEGSLVLTIFTQPDNYTSRYVQLLEEVLPLIKSKIEGCLVKIKPHYRENELHLFKYFYDTYKFVELIDNSITPEELIINSDFVLSMTSAVLFEAIMLNTTGLVANFDGLDNELIYDNDICFPEVNFVVDSAQELVEILQRKSFYIKEYKGRRDKWIIENNGLTIDEIFV